MNIRYLSIALASIALLGLSAPAEAAKPNKAKKGANEGRVLAHLDRDHSGAIDGKEAKRAQAMFAALAALDTNKDGQLSDAELAAAKIPAAAARGKKKAKKSQ